VRKKRAYRAADVKNVRLERVLASSPSGTVSVGLDVGKFEVLAVVRWADGTFERPWKVKNPSEIRQLVRLLREVSVKHALMVTMESTGTYGDALRQALTDAELEIRRVGGRRFRITRRSSTECLPSTPGRMRPSWRNLRRWENRGPGPIMAGATARPRWPTGWTGWMPSKALRCCGSGDSNLLWRDIGRR